MHFYHSIVVLEPNFDIGLKKCLYKFAKNTGTTEALIEISEYKFDHDSQHCVATIIYKCQGISTQEIQFSKETTTDPY